MNMYGLIQTVYDDAKQKAFEDLYSTADVKTQFLLRSTLAQALQDSPKLIPSHGTDSILCTLSQHERDAEETVRVFQAIMNCLHKFSYGMLTDDIQWKGMNEVADSCLVGIGFFREHIEVKHRRKAAPSVDYYTKMGALAYHRLGYDDLGEHFQEWTAFIEKEFRLAEIKETPNSADKTHTNY